MGHSASNLNINNRPVVLIIGGGYAGINLAKQLDSKGEFYTVLIDRKNYFFHNIGALRATVHSEFTKQIIIPYTNLFKNNNQNGIFIQGTVSNITADSINLYGIEESIKFNYLVIATGSSYAFPMKVNDSNNTPALIQKYESVSTAIKSSQKILILGAGPVGIELSTEIASIYPNKSITIVHSQNSPLTEYYSPKLRQIIHQKLTEKFNINLIYNDRLELDEIKGETAIDNRYIHYNNNESKGSFQTKFTHTEINDIDLVFNCTGTKLNNSLFTQQNSEELFSKFIDNSNGRINTNSYLSLDNGNNNIFLIGDSNNLEPQLAVYAGYQSDYLAKNLYSLYSNKSIKPYKSTAVNQPILALSLGANDGTGQYGNFIFPGYLIKLLKSKTLGIEKIQGSLNNKYNKKNQNFDSNNNNEKIESLSKFLSIDSTLVEKLINLPVKPAETGQDRL